MDVCFSVVGDFQRGHRRAKSLLSAVAMLSRNAPISQDRTKKKNSAFTEGVWVWVQSPPPPTPLYRGGALSAVRAQCNYLGVWPY